MEDGSLGGFLLVSAGGVVVSVVESSVADASSKAGSASSPADAGGFSPSSVCVAGGGRGSSSLCTLCSGFTSTSSPADSSVPSFGCPSLISKFFSFWSSSGTFCCSSAILSFHTTTERSEKKNTHTHTHSPKNNTTSTGRKRSYTIFSSVSH